MKRDIDCLTADLIGLTVGVQHVVRFAFDGRGSFMRDDVRRARSEAGVRSSRTDPRFGMPWRETSLALLLITPLATATLHAPSQATTATHPSTARAPLFTVVARLFCSRMPIHDSLTPTRRARVLLHFILRQDRQLFLRHQSYLASCSHRG